jgi:SAM-dependent methyltransferase
MTDNAENYTWRDTNIAQEIHGVRTATNVGGFFTSFLRSGIRLLDCGCGPGTITVGLAELVAPGEVTGIDASADLIASAQGNAARAGLSNATFQTGNVYSLPFADDSFDAVWAHALLEHLHDPVAALAEMRRVLQSGGIIGVRNLDLDSLLISPELPAMVRFVELWIRLNRENGGDMQIGKKLARLLTTAGFRNVGVSATVEQHGLGARQPFVLAGISASNLMALLEPMEARGYATAVQIAEMRQALTDWAESPQGIIFATWCEAIAVK